MFVTVQIPDEIFSRYAERATDRPQQALAATLKEFVDYVPGQPRVVVEGEQLKRLNGIVQLPLGNAKQLVDWLERSGKVSLGEGLEVNLSIAQRERLKAQSDFFTRKDEDKDAAFRSFVSREVQRAVAAVAGV